jgi:hypothetical protein
MISTSGHRGEGANVEPCQPGCQAWLWSAKAGKWAEQPKDAPV